MTLTVKVDRSSELEKFLQRTYDFLVVGGGTSGLVVATRLTENPNVTVGVIEAGNNHIDDPLVDYPGKVGGQLNDHEYCWAYRTIPQPGNRDNVHHMPRGKGLGGSSQTNFNIYIRGQDKDFDDWSKLVRDTGWSAREMRRYILKHQTLEPLAKGGTQSKHHPISAENHGDNGPIRISFNDEMSPLQTAVVDAANQAIRVESENVDLWTGDGVGCGAALGTVTRTGPHKGKRSYSARSYLEPHKNRPNLHILTGGLVSEINLEDDVATGVTFLYKDRRHQIHSRGEVILCGGAINSPQILELSGIGDPKVLEAAGVPLKVSLPGVGTNFKDHPTTTAFWRLAEGIQSLDSMLTPEYLTEAQRRLEEDQSGLLTASPPIQGFFSARKFLDDNEMQEIIDSIRSPTVELKSEFQRRQNEQIMSHLQNPGSATLQFMFFDATMDFHAGVTDLSKAFQPPQHQEGRDGIGFGIGLQYPVSSGHVHITTSNPGEYPAIHPNYLSHPADVAVLATGLKLVEQVIKSPNLKDKISHRFMPSPEKFPWDTVAQRRAMVSEIMMSNAHPACTCAIGQVVDSRL